MNNQILINRENSTDEIINQFNDEIKKKYLIQNLKKFY